jgi:hypothetical protein
LISPKLPHCAVVRPTHDRFAGAQATVASFTSDNLFLGQSRLFFEAVNQLAAEADDAFREF